MTCSQCGKKINTLEVRSALRFIGGKFISVCQLCSIQGMFGGGKVTMPLVGGIRIEGKNKPGSIVKRGGQYFIKPEEKKDDEKRSSENTGVKQSTDSELGNRISR